MSLEVVNCRKCGKLFQRIGRKRYCADCEKLIEEKYQEVKEYLREHPGASLMELSEENDVSIEQIKQWVREERLVFSDAQGSGISCETCGRPIASGRYCDKCKRNVANEIRDILPKKVEPSITKTSKENERMRFLDRK